MCNLMYFVLVKIFGSVGFVSSSASRYIGAGWLAGWLDFHFGCVQPGFPDFYLLLLLFIYLLNK